MVGGQGPSPVGQRQTDRVGQGAVRPREILGCLMKWRARGGRSWFDGENGIENLEKRK